MSRSAMSMCSVTIPCVLILSLGLLGVAPKAKLAQTILEVNCIGVALFVGLPFSVAIFPPVSEKKGETLEPEFKKYDSVFFSKGL